MSSSRTLKDPSLLIGKNLIGGKWIEALTGQRFDIFGSFPTLILTLHREKTLLTGT